MPRSIMPAAWRVGMAGGKLDQTMGGDEPRLGIGPGRQSGIGHPVSHRHFRDTLANGLHDPGPFHARRGRQRGERIEAGPVVYIDEIDPNGFVPEKDLARTGLTGIHLLPFQDLRPACLIHPNGFCHYISLRIPGSHMARDVDHRRHWLVSPCVRIAVTPQ